MLDFGKWIVDVAVNGVKSGSFDRAWAAMQLGNHYSRDRITVEDIARFDTAIDEYEAEMKAEQEEIGEEPVEITDAEQSVERAEK